MTSDLKELKKLERHVRNELQRIRQQIAAGDESEIVVWIILCQLACAQRPLRDHPQFGGSGRSLPPEARPAVVKWVERINQLGIRSIICLMHHKELRHYDSLELDPDGLLGFYRNQGFYVCHLPWPDPAHARTPEERLSRQQQVERIKREALAAFEELPKPVLLHCSAAIDRTTPVAAYITYQRSKMLGPFA